MSLTCYNHLKKNKVPPCAAINGVQFPKKPSFFYLNELECRLLAPRLVFQKVMQAPRGKQLKISGNIVNVTAAVNNTVNMLPGLPNQMATIKVNLKRALRYKSSALSLNVRPHKVIQVAKWLIDTSILYKREGITLNPEWNHNSLHETDTEQNQEHSDYNASTSANRNENLKEAAVENEDNWTEGDVEIPAGVSESLLNVLNVAPGEGNAPLSIFKDMHAEELAYPGIFLGQPRTDNKN